MTDAYDPLASSGPTEAGAAGALIKDSTIETFAEDVMVASRDAPIIVDFWATWCGPCKTLGPMLEKAVTALGGKVKMVKVDIDQNQMLAQQLRIQSVPTVMAFIGGQPVDGFAGALPESEINAFLDRVLQMADQAGLGGQDGTDPAAMLDAADEAFNAGDLATASQAYGYVAQSLEEDKPEKARAIAGLARCHIASGNMDEARQMLEMVPEAFKDDKAVTSVAAALDLAEAEKDAPEVDAAAAKAAANPEDMQAQFDYANALTSAGKMEEGMDVLLAMIAKNRAWEEEAARKQLLKLFDALGNSHELTIQGRRKLSSVLFS
jgi:putative thioredoxin